MLGYEDFLINSFFLSKVTCCMQLILIEIKMEKAATETETEIGKDGYWKVSGCIGKTIYSRISEKKCKDCTINSIH